ncbi:hypothetical protein KZ810_14970 [Sphingomonas sp. RHCKR47]|uniref:hypothetical protein n=1 Tax=Sphingomonas citricola TaxID=2862498 RepID=UPI001CA4D9F8|nr:hypothetical protein [Sphingomonas citricola]MBW6524801.1 hypothetical protein [Sphingomonas citricola]
MTSTSPTPVRPRTGKADALVCAGKPAQSRGVFTVGRMQGLETAAKLLGGQQILGDAIGVGSRNMRAKFAAERGISDGDIRLTVAALEWKAKRLLDHAAKLRGEIIPKSTNSPTPEGQQLDIEQAIGAAR